MKQMHYIPYNQDYLAHHGIKGQKWGVRRWQNSDGTLTPAGRERYGYGEAKEKTGKKFSLFKEKTPEEKAAAAEKKVAKAETRAAQKIEALKRNIRENEDAIVENTRTAEAYARKAEEHRAIAEGLQKRSKDYSDLVADLEWTNARNNKKIEKLERDIEHLKARKISEVEPRLSDLDDKLHNIRDVKVEESETTLRDYFLSDSDYNAYSDWFEKNVG